MPSWKKGSSIAAPPRCTYSKGCNKNAIKTHHPPSSSLRVFASKYQTFHRCVQKLGREINPPPPPCSSIKNSDPSHHHSQIRLQSLAGMNPQPLEPEPLLLLAWCRCQMVGAYYPLVEALIISSSFFLFFRARAVLCPCTAAAHCCGALDWIRSLPFQLVW